MKPEEMDLVFFALAHAARRKILDLLRQMPGCSVADVCKYFDTSRIAVMKHLAVLEQAQLVIPRKQGRVRELYLNVVPIQLIYDRWTTEYSSFWAAKATDLKFLIETGQSLSLDHAAPLDAQKAGDSPATPPSTVAPRSQRTKSPKRKKP